jgi:EAL domain-containing protein (putative c-di-GMP-specific phosphodiesterase class I)
VGRIVAEPSSGPPAGGRSNEELRLAATVDRVIDRRQVTTIFQPLVDLSTTEVVGYEAFCRGPAGSEVESPLALLEGALLAGRLGEFDWLCAAMACEAVVKAQVHPSMTIFVNIKPSTILEPCPEDLRPAIHEAQNRLRIIVDMNEESLTDDPGSLFDAVRAVREAAWGISIDDAAAAPAALALLPLVRPDVLKLDFRSVKGQLAEISKMGDGARIYSEQTQATILAQGIEDNDDIWAARLAGATFGQGWFFGRPAPLPSERVIPTSVFPLVQRPPEVAEATPFELITAQSHRTITEKRFLVPFSHHIEEQVDTNGPAALLLETFESTSGKHARTRARLHELEGRAAFLAVIGADIDRSTLEGPTVRAARLDPSDPVTREWNVIVLGPHYAVAVTARPLDNVSAGGARRFEYAVTHDRDLIVRAALVLWARLPKKSLGN